MGESFWLGERPGKVQMGGMEQLMQQRAQGMGGPSAAELLMNRGMQQQVAAGRSAAASMPGVSPGLAMRQAGQREAGAMADVGQRAAIMRAQEQQAAMQMAAQMELERNMYNAARQQRQGMLGPILQTGGTVLGAALGGPAGAAAGGAIGGGLGGAVGAHNVPQWGDYGLGTGSAWGSGYGGGGGGWGGAPGWNIEETTGLPW